MDKPIIMSRQNSLIKYICGLAEKKIRNKEGLFRFDGIKLLCEVLDSDVEIRYVVCRAPAAKGVEMLVKQALDIGRISSENVIAVSTDVFDKISEEKSPEGVITVVRMMEKTHIHTDPERASELILNSERILVAESLRDPGNLGTVIRSCFALGIDTLVLTDDCADLYNQKTVRAAMGAIFKMRTVSIPVEQLPQLVLALREKGRAVYATALSESAISIEETVFREGDCFVIGNEGHGLSTSVVDNCTASVIIPMREGAESLNAAAAAAICIWETVRKR